MCGVIGVFDVDNASAYANLGLFALQHRGQESAGMAVSDGEKVKHYEGMGLVVDVFRDKNILKLLSGSIAVAHTRYSTTGQSKIENIQPLIYPHPDTELEAQIAISHNGNFPNARKLRDNLESEGVKFYTHTDTELILKFFERSTKETLEEKVMDAFSSIPGTFSAIITTKDKMIAIKDPWGNRPLCMGKLNGGYVVASETCALDAMGAEFERELKPGEILVFESGAEPKSYQMEKKEEQLCIFELIYFARPDGIIKGLSNMETRIRCGERGWQESGVDADYIIPIPDSGIFGADGVSNASRLPCKPYIIKNRYVGRTFIMPGQAIRSSKVKVKLNAIKALLQGKRIVLVDDSLVRGTTSSILVHELFDKYGAKEVHVRLASPPIKHSCFYGIDTATREELIAANKSTEEIRQFIGATTLAYLSLDGLLSSCPGPRENYCAACFNGNYQIPLNGLKAA